MVEVFKTNVERQEHANMLIAALRQQWPLCRINFDLDDCDRILRIEGNHLLPSKIVELMNAKGYQCLALD